MVRRGARTVRKSAESGASCGSIPGSPGVYALVLWLAEPRCVQVGALGEIRFKAGYYAYVGSAQGGLRPRLHRHLRHRRKRRHWHVDYLREVAEPAGVLLWPGQSRNECVLALRVSACADGSVAGFGCSDCRCATHLYMFAKNPHERLTSLRLPGACWVPLD